MGVYISGLQMPKNDGDVLSIDIYSDGNVRLQYNYNLGIIATAIPVPDHGDLVERDSVKGAFWEKYVIYDDTLRVIDSVPTIIPAERSEASLCDNCDERNDKGCCVCKYIKERSEE